MTNPDSLVAANGEPVTISRVSSFSVDIEGSQNVERETEEVKAIISSPSESDQQRLEGRLDEGAITATFASDTDIQATRDGGKDRIFRPATNTPEDPADDVVVYSVEEVRKDTHPLVSMTKLTVVCNRLSGRDTETDMFYWDEYNPDETLTVDGGTTYSVSRNQRWGSVDTVGAFDNAGRVDAG